MDGEFKDCETSSCIVIWFDATMVRETSSCTFPTWFNASVVYRRRNFNFQSAHSIHNIFFYQLYFNIKDEPGGLLIMIYAGFTM